MNRKGKFKRTSLRREIIVFQKGMFILETISKTKNISKNRLINSGVGQFHSTFQLR